MNKDAMREDFEGVIHNIIDTVRDCVMQGRDYDMDELIGEAWQAALSQQSDRIAELELAIERTIDENGHLADGDNCTLHHLVKALAPHRARKGE